jgi:hypothetical protein
MRPLGRHGQPGLQREEEGVPQNGGNGKSVQPALKFFSGRLRGHRAADSLGGPWLGVDPDLLGVEERLGSLRAGAGQQVPETLESVAGPALHDQRVDLENEEHLQTPGVVDGPGSGHILEPVP